MVRALKQLQVSRDSKILMDWANSKCRIDNILLAPIMNQVLEVKQQFDGISFVHIYRNSTRELTCYLKKLCQCRRSPYLFRNSEKGPRSLSWKVLFTRSC